MHAICTEVCLLEKLARSSTPSKEYDLCIVAAQQAIRAPMQFLSKVPQFG